VWEYRSVKRGKYTNDNNTHDLVYTRDGDVEQLRVYLRGELIYAKTDEGDVFGDYDSLSAHIQGRVRALWRRIVYSRRRGIVPICGALRRDGGVCQGAPLPPNGRCRKHFGGWRSNHVSRHKLVHVSEVADE